VDELLKYARLQFAAVGLLGRAKPEIRVAGYGRHRVPGVAILSPRHGGFWCRNRDQVDEAVRLWLHG
jgi:hypothetical protein